MDGREQVFLHIVQGYVGAVMHRFRREMVAERGCGRTGIDKSSDMMSSVEWLRPRQSCEQLGMKVITESVIGYVQPHGVVRRCERGDI
jgi:hypothetical protein